jgi:transposase
LDTNGIVIPVVSNVKADLGAALTGTITTTARRPQPPLATAAERLFSNARHSPGGLVPALPPSVLEPLWDQFAALLPHRDDPHPLGCHRPRIPDRVVFDKLIQVLVFGCGYRRIADQACSATTLRRRRDEWIALGLAEQLRLLVLGAYDRMLGLELTHLAVDGCITKSPCGGQTAGPSPVDRAKQGGKRSVAVEAYGIPLGAVAAPANRRDDGLLAATLQTLALLGPLPIRPIVHLDAGYDWKPCRDELAARGLNGRIARRGQPAPIQVGRRWVIERTHAWANNYGKLRWCTERCQIVVDFWLALTLAIITLGRLIRRAWTHYRWDSRPRRRP